MAKSDAFNRVFPYRIRYRERDLADSARLNAFEKQLERGFKDLERAIGDIYNTENATGSVLADQPLYINSLGRSVGSMAEIIPPLSGIYEFSPVLSNRLSDATYNVIPHPTQEVKCEIGCKFDSLENPNATSRSCLKNQVAFYLQQQGAQTGVCQAMTCPDWSGRDGRFINTTICDPEKFGNTYREYKVVMPPELRTVDTFSVRFYSNCGTPYDRYRVDRGATAFNTDNRNDPQKTWAVASNNSLLVSGTSDEIQYEFPNLDSNGSYIVIVEIPALSTHQIIEVNGVPQAVATGDPTEPTRYLFDLSSLRGASRLFVTSFPASLDPDDIAALSQIWVVEKVPRHQMNYGLPLLLPKVLDTLSPGTEIPPNFVQLFDTDQDVNRIIDNTRIFASRFNPKDPTLNRGTFRDSFDITVFGDQQLEVSNARYLAVTVGTSVATAVGALLEAFVDHVTNTEIHMTREAACELLADRSFCCDDRLHLQIASLDPPNRRRTSAPGTYNISTYIWGAFAPYTVTVNWGDNSNDVVLGIVSGVQQFELATDANPAGGQPYSFVHNYVNPGFYEVDFGVQDNPDVFGCTGSLTAQVSPFTVGSAPDVIQEARLDAFSEYPNYVYRQLSTGYAFTHTSVADWDNNPVYHILTQVHNTDEEDGKPPKFDWIFSNPNGLYFQLYYENVTRVSESLSFTSSSGTLTNDFIQQDSVVLLSGGVAFSGSIDFDVDYETGDVVLLGGGIDPNATVTATYYHYAFAGSLADVSGVNQWIALGALTNSTLIDVSGLTPREDLNTIKFKVREP